MADAIDKTAWRVNRAGLLAMARQAVARWGVGEGEAPAQVRLVNMSENASFHIAISPSQQYMLRLHRPQYHSQTRIESELAWLAVLGGEGIGLPMGVPRAVCGMDGGLIQTLRPAANAPAYYAVLFAYINGETPAANQSAESLVALFRQLGEMAARLHRHSETWQPPASFTRPAWDAGGVYGTAMHAGHWGDWREGPNVTETQRRVLDQAEAKVTHALAQYGKPAHRWGVIHADMRLANLLVDATGDRQTCHLIDFDDCGFGWFMYDFASSVSFIEDTPKLPQLKAAWLAGYRQVREASAADAAMLDTFIMLRRMLLLAWLGSHPEADIAPDLAADFAGITTRLAQNYLRHGTTYYPPDSV